MVCYEPVCYEPMRHELFKNSESKERKFVLAPLRSSIAVPLRLCTLRTGVLRFQNCSSGRTNWCHGTGGKRPCSLRVLWSGHVLIWNLFYCVPTLFAEKIHMHTRTSTHTHTHIQTYTHTRIHTYTHAQTYIDTHTNIHMFDEKLRKS